MAKSKSLKGVSVFITINRAKATEYESPLDETQHEYPNKTVLRYIESISGTNYSILIEVSPGYKLKSSLGFNVKVDGWTLPTTPLFVRSKNSGAWNRTMDGKEQVDNKGRKWKKPFKFSPLNIGNIVVVIDYLVKLTSKIVDLHDNDRIKRDSNASKHIGEIRVTVTRKQTKEEVHYKSRGNDRDTNLEIAEKAIKGQTLSHGTEYVPMNIMLGFGS